MFKDVPNLYKLNPEFHGKVSIHTDVGDGKAGIEADTKQGKRVKKNKNKGEAVPEEKMITKQEERAQKLEAEGGEVNVIDSQDLGLDCEEIANAIA